MKTIEVKVYPDNLYNNRYEHVNCPDCKFLLSATDYRNESCTKCGCKLRIVEKVQRLS